MEIKQQKVPKYPRREQCCADNCSSAASFWLMSVSQRIFLDLSYRVSSLEMSESFREFFLPWFYLNFA